MTPAAAPEGIPRLAALLRLRPYLGRYRGWIALSALAFLGARLLEAAVPLFLREGIDRLDAGVFDVTGPVLGIIACVLVRLAVVAYARITIRRAGLGVAFDLRGDLFERLQRQGAAFYGRHSVGDMMTRAVSDVGLIRRLVSMGFILVVILVYATLVGFSLMFWLAPDLALLVLPPLPLIAWYARRSSRRMGEASRDVQHHLSALTDRTQEAFGGIRTVQALVQEAGEEARFGAHNRSFAQAFYRQAQVSSALTAWLPTLSAIATLTVLGYGGSLVLAGEMSKGTFVAFFSYVAMVIQPMRVAGMFVNMLQRAAIAADRVFDVLDRDDEIADTPSGDTPPVIAGDIRLAQLSYRFPDTDTAALDAVDLHIERGETIAVMGRIGAGKSTLLRLCARMLDAPPDSLLVDGHDIRHWPLQQVRRDIALVPQDPFLFGAPVRENISYDDEPRSDDDVDQAAAIAGLTDVIDTLPERLDTWVGERGVTLSGGQRQRATLARGLIRDASVLLLDDCFSSVDTDTEERILDALLAQRRGRTTVLVTHRASTARHADRIVVLQAGRIVEVGPHEALLARNGAYAALAQRQQDDGPALQATHS